MVPALSHKVSRVSWYSGSCCPNLSFAYGAFTLFGWSSQDHSARLVNNVCSPNPRVHALWFGLFRVRSPLLPESIVFFLFLRLLRCFSSPGSLRMTMDSSYGDWGLLSQVSPFRYPWINGYLHLPMAFRSLSRLSSALSAKASTLRSCLLNQLDYISVIRVHSVAHLVVSSQHKTFGLLLYFQEFVRILARERFSFC